MEKEILNGDELARALKRMGYEIAEQSSGDVVLVSVLRGGAKITPIILEAAVSKGCLARSETIDVSSKRDDNNKNPKGETTLKSTNDLDIILVDDVLYTGRSVRAAIDILMELGRPKRIRVATAIDRGHRELPIKADFVGKNIPTVALERVKVFWEDDKRGAYLIEDAN